MKIVMTKSQRGKALAIINKIGTRHGVAMRSQERAMLRPGTVTGRTERERSNNADCDVYDLLCDLRDIIDPDAKYREAK